MLLPSYSIWDDCTRTRARACVCVCMRVRMHVCARVLQLWWQGTHNMYHPRTKHHLLCVVEINSIPLSRQYLVALSSDAHQEVVGFDVSMYEVLVVHVLDSSQHLVGEHQNGLE